jgi:hypothetical protein
MGADHELPYLLSAQRLTKNGLTYELTADRGFFGAVESPVENNKWEKDDRLSLVFSKPVDGLSVKNSLSAEGAPALVLETLPCYASDFVFRFENIPAHESRFTFRIKPGIKDSSGNEIKDEYIYRIFADGKYSSPPKLTGIRMPMSFGSDDPQFFHAAADALLEKMPINNNYYPSGENIQTWIELYFKTAEGAVIDKFSLMELFRIETSNNVITFSPRFVKNANFSVLHPQPGWENYQRLEITGIMINSVNFGLINFLVGAGLKDSLNNKNEKPQQVLVIK